MLVCLEAPGDADDVRAVHAAAFASSAPDDTGAEPVEVTLVDRLRASGAVVPGLAFVALLDGLVVGHVVCSRGYLDPGGQPALGLGPLGVLPEHQGRGVGSALMHAVLGAADALGEPFVALLGEPDYYGRFGFAPSTRHGIAPPDPAWGEYFQVRPLTAHTTDLTGTFHYAPAFDGM